MCVHYQYHLLVVAALEIAYTLQTGKLVKFSEQEMTDCYYKVGN